MVQCTAKGCQKWSWSTQGEGEPIDYMCCLLVSLMHAAVSMLVHKGMPLARVLCVLVAKSVWIDSSFQTEILNVQQP